MFPWSSQWSSVTSQKTAGLCCLVGGHSTQHQHHRDTQGGGGKLQPGRIVSHHPLLGGGLVEGEGLPHHPRPKRKTGSTTTRKLHVTTMNYHELPSTVINHNMFNDHRTSINQRYRASTRPFQAKLQRHQRGLQVQSAHGLAISTHRFKHWKLWPVEASVNSCWFGHF